MAAPTPRPPCSPTPPSPSDLPQEVLLPWYIVGGAVIAVSCLLGIPANGYIIVAYLCDLRGSSMPQRLLFNLAASDLLCLLCLAAGVVIFFDGTRLTPGGCQLLFYLFCFCMTSDLNILVLISIQRYFQILHTNRWMELRRRWQRVLLSGVWLLGALLALPVVFLITEEKSVEEGAGSPSCKNQRITPELEAAYIIFLVFGYLVTFSFYLLLVRGLKRKQMPHRKKFPVNQVFIRIIAVSLVVGFIPLTFRALHVASHFTASDQLLRVSKKLIFVECFYSFNHLLNPFLYFFASRRQRKESKAKRNGFLMPLNDMT